MDFLTGKRFTLEGQGASSMPGAFVGGENDGRPWWGNAPSSNTTPQSSGTTEDQDIVIAVMGATGAGKSTFIKTVSGRNDVVVGNNLSSGLYLLLRILYLLLFTPLLETQEVRAYEFFHKGTNYILVDTPGFDDTTRSDTEITEQILTWLKTSLLEGTRLNGVIYLHRISDPRMGGTALRNNRMFRKLCGEDAFKNVILATTFWEWVTLPIGAKREEELCSNRDFWGGMLEKGAKIVRLKNNRQCGLDLLEKISANGKVVLSAQDEMVNQGQSVSGTSLLREEREQIERVQRELEAQLEAALLQIEIDAAYARKEQELEMQRERERLQREREAQRVAEERRQAREKWEAQQRYERQLERAREDRLRQEERRRREVAEMERKEREEKERLRKREEEAAAEVVRRRLEYQRNYVCIGYSPQWPCDKCKGRVQEYKYYYRKSILGCIDSRVVY